MKRIIMANVLILLLAVIGPGCLIGILKPLDPESLKNAEYNSQWPLLRKAKLTEGTYREKFAPDSSTEILITLSDYCVFGDFNGDGAVDAAGILISRPGGSGTFYDLALLLNEKGTPRHVDTVSLGDRIQVKSLTLEDGAIRLTMVVHGPKDPVCCPTLAVTWSFKVEKEKLVAVR